MTESSLIDDDQEKYLVPGLQRGLRLLCEFSRHDKTLSAPELAHRLQLPRSTVFRLLATLESMGFIERCEGGREFRLGVAVLRLGFEYLASLELTELGRPVLERLRDDIGYSCNLVVRDGRSIVYVAKSAAPTPFASSVTIGTRLPAHATVFGRVLLADLTLAQLRALYPEERLEAYSERTPKTAVELFEMVQQDRERGYVFGEGFFEGRISTIAAPVLGHRGNVLAALGVTIPTASIERATLDRIIRQVRDAASDLSHLLDHAPQQDDRKVVNLRSK